MVDAVAAAEGHPCLAGAPAVSLVGHVLEAVGTGHQGRVSSARASQAGPQPGVSRRGVDDVVVPLSSRQGAGDVPREAELVPYLFLRNRTERLIEREVLHLAAGRLQRRPQGQGHARSALVRVEVMVNADEDLQRGEP